MHRGRLGPKEKADWNRTGMKVTSSLKPLAYIATGNPAHTQWETELLTKQALALQPDCLGSNPDSAIATCHSLGNLLNFPKKWGWKQFLPQMKTAHLAESSTCMSHYHHFKVAPSARVTSWEASSLSPVNVIHQGLWLLSLLFSDQGIYQIGCCYMSLISMQTVSSLWAKFACPLLPDFHKWKHYNRHI